MEASARELSNEGRLDILRRKLRPKESVHVKHTVLDLVVLVVYLVLYTVHVGIPTYRTTDSNEVMYYSKYTY